MQKLFVRRAQVRSVGDKFEITIPTCKNPYVLTLAFLWMAGWALGLAHGLGVVLRLGGRADATAPAVFIPWIAVWAVLGLLAGWALLWNLSGRETLVFENGTLTVTRRGLLVRRRNRYSLDALRKIRLRAEDETDTPFGAVRPFDFGIFGADGAIRFRYEGRTVHVACGMAVREAKWLLASLAMKKVLTKQHIKLIHRLRWPEAAAG